MSCIRFIIALVFLIAGVDTELRADASHFNPADSHTPPSLAGITSPHNKTSPDKLIKIASEMDPWILSVRLDIPVPSFRGLIVLSDRLWLPFKPQTDDSFCVSGCSPPFLSRS